MFDYFILHSVLVENPKISDIWQKRPALAPKYGENFYLRRISTSVSDKNYHIQVFIISCNPFLKHLMFM